MTLWNFVYNAAMLLRTFGGLELTGTPFSRPKPLLFLAYLALEGPKERRHLAELFWPGATDPMNRLAVTLTRLKQGAQGAADGDAVQVWARVRTDAQGLLAAVEEGRYEEALSLYRGPFLAGVIFGAEEGELEEWAYSTREFLAAQVGAAHLALARAQAERGRFGAAAEHAEAAYQSVKGAGAAPEELRDLHTLLLAGGHPRAQVLREEADGYGLALHSTPEDARGALRRASNYLPNNLPIPSGSFVGRDLELAQLAALLADPARRLVTVLGAGGVGKTRLALEAARQQLRLTAFRDGVFFVVLDALTREGEVPAALAGVLEPGTSSRDDPGARLARLLAPKRLLLVIDNLEHVIGCASLLAALLRRCPELKLLVTSRARLNLADEWLFPLSGLSLPAADVPTEALSSAPLAHDALRLFEERARQVQPGFTLAPDNLAGAVTLCRLLEGYPLGIELTAPWTRLLSCTQIAGALARDLSALDSPGAAHRDAPERHRSLRAAFTHSWRLLDPDERTALAQLSVFRGGFTGDAAEAVAGASLPVLASLVDKSLLHVVSGGRYDRHPLLYGYAQEKLAERPDEQAGAEARHAAYFGALAEQLDREVTGAEPQRAYARLAAELENFRAVWRWAVANRSAQTFGQCSKALGWHFYDRWHDDEPLKLWTAAVNALDTDDPAHYPALAMMLGLQSGELSEVGRLDEARAAALRGLKLLRSLQGAEHTQQSYAQKSLCGCLNALANVTFREGRYDETFAYLYEVGALGDEEFKGAHLNNLGLVETRAGHYEAARGYYLRALELNRRQNSVQRLVRSLGGLGEVCFYSGDLPGARRYFGEAAALVRRAGLSGAGGEDRALLYLGRVALEEGKLAEAEALARELMAAYPTPETFLYNGVLELLGCVALARSELEAAASYLERAVQLELTRLPGSVSQQLNESWEALLPLVELWLKEKRYTQVATCLGFLLRHLRDAYARTWAERLLAEVRCNLPPKELEAALRQGSDLSLETFVHHYLHAQHPTQIANLLG